MASAAKPPQIPIQERRHRRPSALVSNRVERKAVKIATVYKKDTYNSFVAHDMALTRWLRMSQALADLGYSVDMIVNTSAGLIGKSANFRYVPYSLADWRRYNLVKTLFPKGFDSLCEHGGGEHPFIISKLGSVVGKHETAGVHFFGDEREKIYATQENIARTSKYVTILTQESSALWKKEFGPQANILRVPTGVERQIPAPGSNPYRSFHEKIAVYIGNIYTHNQREVNLLWQEKLNQLGRCLRNRGVRLCFVGVGRVDRIDRRLVTCFGPVANDDIWDYHYFADVGIVLAQGAIQHNESSKIYYYLRAGLPVVSEEPVPNNFLIREANLGYLADYGDTPMLAGLVEKAAKERWDRQWAVRYVLEHHTWDQRAQVYDSVIAKELNLPLSEAT